MSTNYFRSILLGAVLVSAIAGPAAAESQKQDDSKDKKAIALENINAKQTRLTIKKLSHGIDLWHDANLKGDFDRVFKFEKKINEIIRADIKKSVKAVAESEWQHELDLQKNKPNSHDEGTVEKNNKDQVHQRAVWKSSRKLIKAKEVLFVSLKRSRAFSNKYRLLNDYLDLLKRELGIERIELAEDMNDWGEDQ